MASPVTGAKVPQSASATQARPRLDAVDLLRGLVMVLMALDHTRDYLMSPALAVRDVHSPALFLTRWVTNFCAPTFVFLAGAGAFLYGSRGRTRSQVSGYLISRGLWLIFLELTLVRFGWTFSIRADFLLLQVIWTIGWSMLCLSLLLYLPRPVLAVLATVLIAGHNLLDGIKAESFGRFQVIWQLLHQPGLFQIGPDIKVLTIYPLIPWLGVMLAGFAFGPVLRLDAPRRRRVAWVTGGLILGLFLVLRSGNWYGDPGPWAIQNGAVASVLSFINCEKYPPSLLFLSMILGPALLMLGAFDGKDGRVARFFVVYGRVPFAYYVAHIYLVHLAAVLVALLQHSATGWLFQQFPPMARPEGTGLGLLASYGVWILVVIALYPLCQWFGQIKQRRKAWWLSYL